MMKLVAGFSDDQMATDFFEMMAEKFHDYKFVRRENSIYVDEDSSAMRLFVLAYVQGLQKGMSYKNGAA